MFLIQYNCQVDHHHCSDRLLDAISREDGAALTPTACHRGGGGEVKRFFFGGGSVRTVASFVLVSTSRRHVPKGPGDVGIHGA